VSAANEELKTEIAEHTKPDEKLRRSEASLLEGQTMCVVGTMTRYPE
jgi:C4-dicarboxylate-specific signal transduction histidine kinase